MLKISKKLLILALGAFVISCSGAKQQEATEEDVATTEQASSEGLAIEDGTYTIDPATSQLEWVGKKVTGQHNGTIEVSEGNVMVSNGAMTGGSFTIDLNTITALDLKDDPETQAKLEGHLKSDDFFHVELSPVSTFEITSVSEATEGDATHVITGNLTIKNITNEVEIPVTVSAENGVISTRGTVMLDRTKWDMMFHSGFEQWADKTIDDEFEVTIDLKASKAQA